LEQLTVYHKGHIPFLHKREFRPLLSMSENSGNKLLGRWLSVAPAFPLISPVPLCTDTEAQCATRNGRTGFDVLLQSSWYILVSTGAVMGLIVVLACSIVLLGVHLSITHARGVLAELSAHLR
jgi:hypothetical protein